VLKLLCNLLNADYAVLSGVDVQHSFCYTDSSKMLYCPTDALSYINCRLLKTR